MLIASKTDNAVQISIIGEIMGETMWTTTEAAFLREALDKAAGMPVDLWVSSPGGSLEAGLAMRAMLAAYEGQVTVHTAGMVASAATLLLCLPNARVIAERGSVFMIHTARAAGYGDAEEMRKCADVLDVCDDVIAEVYKVRMKCGDDELKDMMAEETWLKASDALELGLVDEVADATSGGYVAEPKNPDPLPDAVSARLSPRIEAITAGLDNLTSAGEKRIQALNSAAETAVSGIVDASGKTVASIIDAGEHVSAAISEDLKAVRAELEAARAMYEESQRKYACLDEALSRVYALHGGDPSSCGLHDEQRGKSTFKLNI